MKKKLYGIICILLVLALAVTVFGGCKKKEEESDGIVVERTFDATPTPAPTVTPTPEPTVEPTPTPGAISGAEGAEGLAYATEDLVNVREVNATSGTVLGQLPIGTVVAVVKREYGNGWSQISYNGVNAFVATQYIRMITTESSIAIECTATVNSEDTNMRADNTTESDAVGKLAKGTKVDVVKKDYGHGWSMLQYESKIVYVATRYLDF